MRNTAVVRSKSLAELITSEHSGRNEKGEDMLVAERLERVMKERRAR